MARLAALLGPLATLILRELGRTGSVAGNHFLLFVVLLFAMNPRSAVFLVMVAGLVLLFPLSADPLRRIPAERFLLLPLSTSERIRIRVLGLFLSPVIWVVLGVALWSGKRYVGISLMLLFLALFFNGISLLWARDIGQVQRVSPLRHLPILPGLMGGLLTKNIREMFHVLDPYAGMALAIPGAIYRFTSPKPVPEVMQGITMLVALTLSTYAQRLFALDSDNGFERYGLMPIRGWQVLLAKDLAFLLILMLLVLPLNPLSGLAAGVVLLTIGHRPSVLEPQSQPRWCFVTGVRGWSGVGQVIAMFVAGTATYQFTPLVLIPCATLYLASLVYYGSRFEARWAGNVTSAA